MFTKDGISTTFRPMKAPWRTTAAGHGAEAGRLELVGAPAVELVGDLVPPGARAAPAPSMSSVVVEAEGQQHRLLQPLVRDPDAVGAALGDPQPGRESSSVQRVRRPPRGPRRWVAAEIRSARSSQAASIDGFEVGGARSVIRRLLDRRAVARNGGQRCGAVVDEGGGRASGRAGRPAPWSCRASAAGSRLRSESSKKAARGRIDAVARRSSGRRCAGRAWACSRPSSMWKTSSNRSARPSCSSTRSAWPPPAVGEDQPPARQPLQGRAAGAGSGASASSDTSCTSARKSAGSTPWWAISPARVVPCSW